MEGGTRLNVVKQDACIVQPITIESTLQFDDIVVVPGLPPLLWGFKGDVCGQEIGAGDSLGTRLPTSFMGNMGKYHPGYFG